MHQSGIGTVPEGLHQLATGQLGHTSPISRICLQQHAQHHYRGIAIFANKGYHPTLSTDTTMVVLSSEAQQFVVQLDEIHDNLKQSITDTQEHYQKCADQHRASAPPFKIGNKVFIKARFFKTTLPLKKLFE